MSRLMSVDPETLPDRFWQKVTRGGDEECWLWQGATFPDGYGSFRVSPDKVRGAHRVSWTLAHGDPGDLHVLHRCDVPACVNPAHLFLGTNEDNVADKVAKGRHPNTLMERCRSGHLFDEENTYRPLRGGRQCRACNRASQQRYSARRKEA